MNTSLDVAESGDESYRRLAILRWVMVVIFASFGMQKFTLQSADAWSALLSGGFQDQRRDLVRMGDQSEVTRFHLDGLGAHALGHEALEIGIDGAVLG